MQKLEHLNAALIMLFDGVYHDDIANAIVTALGKDRAQVVMHRIEERLPYAALCSIDRWWFNERLEMEDKVYVGTEEEFTDLVHAFRDGIDDDYASHMMDQFVAKLFDEKLVVFREDCPTAPEHSVLDVLTSGGKDE